MEVINMFQSKNQGGRDSEGRQAGAPGATANSNTPTPTPTNPGDAPGVASERHSGTPTQRIRRHPIRQRTDFVRVCKRERIYRHICNGGEFAYNELISSTLPPPTRRKNQRRASGWIGIQFDELWAIRPRRLSLADGTNEPYLWDVYLNGNPTGIVALLSRYSPNDDCLHIDIIMFGKIARINFFYDEIAMFSEVERNGTVQKTLVP